MLEATRPQRERLGSGPGGLGDMFSAPDAPGMVTVSSGVHGGYPLPVAGMTVAEIRRRYADRLDIDPRSQAHLDGREVSDQTIVQAGQQLEFMRRAGEKGAAGCAPAAG